MENYKGVIIEESLKNKEVLKRMSVLSTQVEKVEDQHQTPWLSQWTLHMVEIDGNNIEEIAEIVSKSLDYSHNSSWYADFKNKLFHYIVFKDKVFCVNRNEKESYREAKEYGISLGIPEYQLGFDQN
jgi:hypothetical protein